MPHTNPTGWAILLDLLMGAAAGLAGGFVRWNHPERRRLGWCLAWELPSAALVGSAGYALGGLLEFNEYGRFLFAFVFGYLVSREQRGSPRSFWGFRLTEVLAFARSRPASAENLANPRSC